MRIARLTRRTLIGGLSASALAVACTENPATGRPQFMLVSDAQLAQLASAAWIDVKSKVPVSGDVRAQERLLEIGRRVVEASDLSSLDWEFVLFDSPEINAFVLPGGKVGFFRGLFELAGGDDEIAAVMGHEVGHVVARHAAERVSQQLAVQTGVSIAGALLQEDLGAYADDVAGALGMGLVYGVILPYSRRHELEADRLGVALMDAAGYAPVGASRFWRRMIAANGAGPQALEWLSTHPADDTRLAALEGEITRLGSGVSL